MELNQPPEVSPPEQKDRTLLNIALAGCGCLVLVAVVFGLFAGKAFKTFRGPARIVQHHLDALNRSDLDTAYGYFSLNYRRKNRITDFRSGLEAYSASFPLKDSTLNRVNIVNDTATVEGMVTDQNGVIISVVYRLVLEGREWRIDNYTWQSPGETKTI